MSTLLAAIALTLPLPAAAAGHDRRDSPVERVGAGGLAFSSFDLVLLLGGAVVVVAVGSGTRRLLRERA